jgi:hypothetical protein
MLPRGCEGQDDGGGAGESGSREGEEGCEVCVEVSGERGKTGGAVDIESDEL